MYKRIFLLIHFQLLLFSGLMADGFNSIARTNASLKKASEAMKKKEYRQAVTAYEEAFRENPDISAQARLNLAHACFQSGLFSKAKKNYQAALASLQDESQKSAACLQLGNIYSKEKDYKSALEWYRKSLLNNPSNQKARLNFELAWKLQKQKEQEQKKGQPQRNPNQQENKQQEKQPRENQNQQKQKNEEKGGQQNQDQKKEEEKNKPKSDRGRPDEKGKEQEDAREEESNQKGKNAEESKPADDGSNSKKKNQESNQDDPEAFRMDKKKLKESGLNEEQARNMLQAMRQSEVKYLQQKRFKAKSGSKSGPRW